MNQKPLFLNHKKPHIHFIGIGGIGMSGIAEIFHLRGFIVSGSDKADSETLQRLKVLGVKTYIGHHADNITGASVIVYSSAVKFDNPEIVAAKKESIPIIPRAEALGELMRGKIGIAVAGTHGKTTTTSLLSTVFTHAKLDPTCIIGGKVDALGGNAKSGSGEYMIAEADESDGSFLQLPATYAIITNIDNDHLDHYGSVENIDDAFSRFVGHLPFYGLAMVCADDPGIKRVLKDFKKPYKTYGFSKTNDYYIELNPSVGHQTKFSVYFDSQKIAEVEINILGKHNALNALSVFALSHQMGLSIPIICEGLKSFSGVKRRFETKYLDQKNNIRIVDDYGHHPTEITATLLAAKQLAENKRIIAVFQPHRYSRTQSCIDDFASCFSDCDTLFLTPIYSAGEHPIAGINSEFLVEKINQSKYKPKKILGPFDLESMPREILKTIKPGDLVLCLGAGSITQLPALLISSLINHKGFE